MLEYRFDTQLLIEGENLSEDDIHDYITQNIPGDCLLAVGDEDLDQAPLSHQRALEGAGVRRFTGGSL